MEDPDRSGHPGTPGRGAFLVLYLKAAVETESDIMSPTKEQERNAMKRPRASKGGFIYAKRVRIVREFLVYSPASGARFS